LLHSYYQIMFARVCCTQTKNSNETQKILFKLIVWSCDKANHDQNQSLCITGLTNYLIGSIKHSLFKQQPGCVRQKLLYLGIFYIFNINACSFFFLESPRAFILKLISSTFNQHWVYALFPIHYCIVAPALTIKLNNWMPCWREKRDWDIVRFLLSLRVYKAHYRVPPLMHLVLQRQLTQITTTADCNNQTRITKVVHKWAQNSHHHGETCS